MRLLFLALFERDKMCVCIIAFILAVIFAWILCQNSEKIGLAPIKPGIQFGTKVYHPGWGGKEYKREKGWAEKEVGIGPGKRRCW